MINLNVKKVDAVLEMIGSDRKLQWKLRWEITVTRASTPKLLA